ncbi:hypothetical protein L3Y21_gp105 [Gordonia phage Rabbitrun]|uniref:Uncharacterized protein n=1 Tax=Gordonia phage Rabbitrun TaxID=2762280 RepID=A0A7G8LIV3_9CAUD|nr:hypothetical protein L3Y21_gp105 [Gordonia phage Rabbitrun]QNJ57175.1 hypothetical protein SEA_RABBITRUN_131 [Gordonia phage Rabbitrun]
MKISDRGSRICYSESRMVGFSLVCRIVNLRW